MLSSFFIKSARNGPTPFRYSMGENNMVDAWVWMFFICYKYRVVIVYKNEVVKVYVSN